MKKLSDIVMELGKVQTDKDNPPFKTPQQIQKEKIANPTVQKIDFRKPTVVHLSRKELEIYLCNLMEQLKDDLNAILLKDLKASVEQLKPLELKLDNIKGIIKKYKRKTAQPAQAAPEGAGAAPEGAGKPVV